MELFTCLDAVEHDAAGALDRDRQPVLFDRLSWHCLLRQHCPPPGELLVARAQDEAGDRCWLFLSVKNGRAFAHANWYTLRFDSVYDIDGTSSWRLNGTIARCLRRRGLSSVELYPSTAADSYRLAYAAEGWLAHARTQNLNWVADVAGMSFADYWSRRPAALRRTVARKTKSSALDISIYNAFDVDAWTEYEAIYRASWKPEEGSPAFLRALAGQEGAAGTLRLGIARKHGQAVAAQFWLVENGRATIHKLAHRKDAEAFSPGTLLSAAMFHHAIDTDRVATIDFGLGNEPFKADWMDRSEPVGRMTAHNPRTLAGAVGVVRELVHRLRND